MIVVKNAHTPTTLNAAAYCPSSSPTANAPIMIWSPYACMWIASPAIIKGTPSFKSARPLSFDTFQHPNPPSRRDTLQPSPTAATPNSHAPANANIPTDASPRINATLNPKLPRIATDRIIASARIFPPACNCRSTTSIDCATSASAASGSNVAYATPPPPPHPKLIPTHTSQINDEAASRIASAVPKISPFSSGFIVSSRTKIVFNPSDANPPATATNASAALNKPKSSGPRYLAAQAPITSPSPSLNPCSNPSHIPPAHIRLTVSRVFNRSAHPPNKPRTPFFSPGDTPALGAMAAPVSLCFSMSMRCSHLTGDTQDRKREATVIPSSDAPRPPFEITPPAPFDCNLPPFVVHPFCRHETFHRHSLLQRGRHHPHHR